MCKATLQTSQGLKKILIWVEFYLSINTLHLFHVLFQKPCVKWNISCQTGKQGCHRHQGFQPSKRKLLWAQKERCLLSNSPQSIPTVSVEELGGGHERKCKQQSSSASTMPYGKWGIKDGNNTNKKLSSVQSLSHVWFFADPKDCSTPNFPVQHQLPELYSNSCPSSQWYHPTISSSVIPFSSCLQSFWASGSFPMSPFFTSGNQSIGASASASDLPLNTQDWFPLGWTVWIPL